MTCSPAIRKLEDEALAHQADLEAIIDEHVPEELRARCRDLMDNLIGVAYSISDINERELYGALIALIPDHVKQTRAAFSATILEAVEDDWEEYERGLAHTIMPDSKARRLLRGEPID